MSANQNVTQLGLSQMNYEDIKKMRLRKRFSKEAVLIKKIANSFATEVK